MKFWFEVLTAVVMCALAAWYWVQVKRHPRDLAFSVLALAITTLAFTLTTGIDLPLFEGVKDLLSEISFSNIAWGFMFYCYSVFFLLSRATETDQKQRRRIHWQAVLEFAIWLCLITPALIALLDGPPGFWGKYRDPETYRTARNAIYFTGVTVYPIAAWCIGTLRAIDYRKAVSHRWARRAAAGVILGVGLMAIQSGISLSRQVLYVVYPGSRWPELRDWYNIARLSGQIILALSFAAIPLIALAARVRERRSGQLGTLYAADVAPLWRRLVAEFPQVRLSGQVEDSEPGRVDLQPPPEFDRMQTEVSDGLAYLEAWADTDRPAETSTAEQIAQALAAKRIVESSRWTGENDEPESAASTLPQWEPNFADRDSMGRAKWMADLARELTRLDVLDTGLASQTGERCDAGTE